MARLKKDNALRISAMTREKNLDPPPPWEHTFSNLLPPAAGKHSYKSCITDGAISKTYLPPSVPTHPHSLSYKIYIRGGLHPPMSGLPFPPWITCDRCLAADKFSPDL